jgi:hypothetical protein
MSMLLRGGPWDGGPWHCRSAFRYYSGPDFANFDVGFRLVASAVHPSPYKLLRGGSWDFYSRACSSAHRYKCERENTDYDNGFRLVAPVTPSSPVFVLLRGGSWCTCTPKLCRSAFRGHYEPDDAIDDVGFRLAAPSSPSIASPSMPVLSDAFWESFNIDAARKALELPLGKQTYEWESPLASMCLWSTSPQGHGHWRDMRHGKAPFTAEDKAIIQGWVEAWEARQAKEAPALSLREDALQALFDIALALPPDACVKDAMMRVKTALESLPQ